MSLETKAKELAEAIKETDEYEALKSAETRIKLDPQAQELVDEFQEKQQEIQMAQQSGQQVNQDSVLSIQRIQGQMEQNLTLKNLMKAQKEFNDIMQNVNKVITENLG